MFDKLLDNYIWRLSGPNTLFQYTIDTGYPKPLSSWTGLPSEIDADVTSTNETLTGLPSKIDAAVAWSKYRIMFFSGGKYYSYNRSKRSVSTFLII